MLGVSVFPWLLCTCVCVCMVCAAFALTVAFICLLFERVVFVRYSAGGERRLLDITRARKRRVVANALSVHVV